MDGVINKQCGVPLECALYKEFSVNFAGLSACVPMLPTQGGITLWNSLSGWLSQSQGNM